ncbi:hypothetical protein L6R29_04930 [Myxococcota bacterium]|nr:hypothetical protein [Myxococcota bacterium]
MLKDPLVQQQTWNAILSQPAPSISQEELEDCQDEALDCLEYIDEKLVEMEGAPHNEALWQRIQTTYARVHELGWLLRLRPGLELLQRIRAFLDYIQTKQLELKLEDIRHLLRAGGVLRELIRLRNLPTPPPPSPDALLLSAPPSSTDLGEPLARHPTLKKQHREILQWFRQQIEQEEIVQRMHAGASVPALGDLLVTQGLISPPILRQVMAEKPKDERLGESLINAGKLSPAQLQKTLDLQERFKRRTHGTFSLDNQQMLELRGWIGEMGAMLHQLQQHTLEEPTPHTHPNDAIPHAHTHSDHTPLNSPSAPHTDPSTLHPFHTEGKQIVQHLRKLHKHLAQRVRSLSMIPLSRLFARLQPHIEELSARFQHPLTLSLEDNACEVELYQQSSVEQILRDLLRNAIEHGIETTEERQRAHKPPIGTLRIHAHIAQRGPNDPHRLLILTVEDDGRGLDWPRLQEEARRQGFLQRDDTLDENRIVRLLLEEKLAQGARSLSAGMGFVQISKHLQILDATLHYHRQELGGCAFSIHLPIPTTYLFGCHFSRYGSHFFIPASTVRDIIPAQEAITSYHTNGQLALHWYDEPLLPIVRLPSFQPHRPHKTPPHAFVLPPNQALQQSVGHSSYLVMESTEGLIALYVDTIHADQMAELVFVGSSYLQHPAISGGARLTNGTYAWIIDPAKLYLSHLSASSNMP